MKDIKQKMNRKNLSIVAIILLLVIFSTYQYMDKQKYIKYLSNNIATDVGNIQYSILMSNSFLNKVIRNKELSKEDLQALKYWNDNIYNLSISNMQLADDYLNKTANENNKPITFYDTLAIFREYFNRIDADYFVDTNTLKLNNNQLERFKWIKKVNDRWIEEVKANLDAINNGDPLQEKIQTVLHGSYYNLFDENHMVTKNNWVVFLNNLIDKTEQLVNESFSKNDLRTFMLKN